MNPADGNLPLSSNAGDSNRTAAALYRSPTWAKNINFDSDFDVNLGGSPEHSGYVSPAEVPNALARDGSPQVEAFAEASGSKPQSGKSIALSHLCLSHLMQVNFLTFFSSLQLAHSF